MQNAGALALAAADAQLPPGDERVCRTGPSVFDRNGAGARSANTKAKLAQLQAEAQGLDAHGILELALTGEFAGRAALVSSFGAESAVLLHLVAQIDPHTPILLLNTGRLFGETLHYRDRLQNLLGLSDVRSLETPYPLAPGETIHGITRERITLPGDIGGWLEGRSRFARLGLMIHVTSGFVQPGVATRHPGGVALPV